MHSLGGGGNSSTGATCTVRWRRGTLRCFLCTLPVPQLQELTSKALHILRKLVENKREDCKASVLEWETVGDDPEVPCTLEAELCVCRTAAWGTIVVAMGTPIELVYNCDLCAPRGPPGHAFAQSLRAVQLELLAVGAPAVLIRLISSSPHAAVVHDAIVASIAMLYVQHQLLPAQRAPHRLPCTLATTY
jgi:hypothetical protein